MIRMIAAIDDKLGLANDEAGIPWGFPPSDRAYFREKTLGSTILMGQNTYQEFEKPLSGRRSLVATRSDEPLREGFEPVTDAEAFLREFQADIWVIGGAGLFAGTIELADELYLTRVHGDFNCTKFFPQFEQDFERVSKEKDITENGISFHFETWKRKTQ